MIIQCPECQTRFMVADTKVKPDGIKVRCAKCRHIFVAQRPPEDLVPESQAPVFPGQDRLEQPRWGSEPAAPSRLTTDLAAAAEPPAPSSEPDIDSDSLSLDQPPAVPGGDEFDDFEEFSLPQGTATPATPAEPTSTPSDNEFDFGEPELSADMDEELAFDTEGEAESTAASFGDEVNSQGEELAFASDFASADEEELAFEDEPTFETEEELFPSDAAPFSEADDFPEEETSSFEAEDEFSFAEEPAAEPPDEFSGDEFAFEESSEPEPGEAEDFFNEGAEAFSLEEPEDQASAFSWEEDGSEESDDLSGPGDEFDFGDAEETPPKAEEFDFSGMTFGDEEPPEPVTAAPPQPDDDFGSLSLDLDQPVKNAATGTAAAAPSPPPAEKAPSTEKPAMETPLSAPAKRKGPLSGLTMFLLFLLLALLGAAGYFIWSEGSLDKALQRLTGQQPPAEQTGQIRLSELSSFFVNSDAEGQLFVISGQAVNDFPGARSAITVKGVLYDKNGKALVQQTVFCGNSLAEETLNTMPFSQIEESMNNQFGDSLSNLNIGPGKAIPFTIVFKNLPPDLAEFIVEVVDSKPASK